jgi:hypothetical protein
MVTVPFDAGGRTVRAAGDRGGVGQAAVHGARVRALAAVNPRARPRGCHLDRWRHLWCW